MIDLEVQQPCGRIPREKNIKKREENVNKSIIKDDFPEMIKILLFRGKMTIKC